MQIKVLKQKVILGSLDFLYFKDLKDKLKFIWDAEYGIGIVSSIEVTKKRSKAEIIVETPNFKKKYSIGYNGASPDCYLSLGYGDTIPYWWSSPEYFIEDFRAGIEDIKRLKEKYYKDFLRKEKEEKEYTEYLEKIKSEIPEHFL